MKKILILLLMIFTVMNIWSAPLSSNMNTIGTIESSNRTMVVKANETTVVIYVGRNNIALDYNAREKFIQFLDLHSQLSDAADSAGINYRRDTGQMMDSSSTRIIFSFYSNGERSGTRLNISTWGENQLYFDMTKDQMQELKSFLENAVMDRDELASKINDLNAIVNDIRKL